jgi:small basic protein
MDYEDPRALTVLTTEHWSLMSARQLVYNEAFTRAGMFLTFLSTTLVGLGLVWTGTGFSRAYLITAAVVLGIDLFVGLASMARILNVTEEDARLVQGMNRLRNAYHEIVPGLQRYFVTEHHDDVASVMVVYGRKPSLSWRGLPHGLTTAAGMIGVFCAVVVGILTGIVVFLVTDQPTTSQVAAVVAAAVGIAIGRPGAARRMARFGASMASEFPKPE